MPVKINKRGTLISAILVLVTVYMFNSFWSYKNYTLYDNGNWESGKTKLKKGVIAAWCMMFTKAGLSKNILNISAWLGYQELIYKKPVCPSSVTFRCRAYNRQFCFYTNKTDTVSEGLYFSYSHDTTCCRFKVNNAGKFIYTQNFTVGKELKNNHWNTCRVSFTNDSGYLMINNKAYGCWPQNINCNRKIGFRGSGYNVYVDDIYYTDRAGNNILIDNFTPPSHINSQALWLLAVLLALLILFNGQRLYISAVSLFIMSAFCLIYFWVLSAWYPRSFIDIDFKGHTSSIELEGQVRARLRKEYPLNEFSGKKNLILFIGSSQTWGAGISTQGKTMPQLIEDTLRTFFNDTSITVINCGISGHTSEKLLAVYKTEWIKYRPSLVIINSGTNDADTAVLRNSIHQFLDLDDSLKIKTVLIAEPNDLYHTEKLKLNHLILVQEAAKYKRCSMVQVQAWMDSCNTKGFIWWDYVHLTDYGYELMADKITAPIIVAVKGSDRFTFK